MTIYIDLQGCLEMENKEISQSVVEAKSEAKAGTDQQPYTKEFKDKLVEIYNSGIYESAAECARNYQVPERLLYQWISANKKQSKPGDQSFELAKLKKENTQLKMELELLKKATVYFAKQMK
jgi:transposase